jgi:hypothetical protein
MEIVRVSHRGYNGCRERSGSVPTRGRGQPDRWSPPVGVRGEAGGAMGQGRNEREREMKMGQIRTKRRNRFYFYFFV